MSKFIVEESFWELFPRAEFGIILVKGVDNTMEGAGEVRSDILELLAQSAQASKKYITADVFSENPVIAVWRDAYKKFKTKKGVRASIEALLKRVEKGSDLPVVNPLVDIYNAVSFQYGLPCGGEDLDTFQGDLRLTITSGGDEFLALGDEENNPTLPGEVCYLDEKGAVCRCWNWRDGQRTMLTENTKNAFLIIESVDPSRHEDLQAALEMLSHWTIKCLGGERTMQIVDRDHPMVEFGSADATSQGPSLHLS